MPSIITIIILLSQSMLLLLLISESKLVQLRVKKAVLLSTYMIKDDMMKGDDIHSFNYTKKSLPTTVI